MQLAHFVRCSQSESIDAIIVKGYFGVRTNDIVITNNDSIKPKLEFGFASAILRNIIDNRYRSDFYVNGIDFDFIELVLVHAELPISIDSKISVT